MFGNDRWTFASFVGVGGGFAPGLGATTSEDEGIVIISLQFGGLQLPSDKHNSRLET